MDWLFGGCKSFTSLADISNWDTSNLKTMRHIFRDCTSLKSLPDITKWIINKNININKEGMFYIVNKKIIIKDL